MNGDQKLILYDQLRSALAECIAIDEIAGIKNKAAQLEAYARVRDDAESQRQFAELRLRACIRIGEISRELETAENQYARPNDGTSKTEALKEAGISRSTANRYEELAGGREEQAQKIAAEAAQIYFAEQREKEEPSTMQGLQTAIKSAVVGALGEPPKKAKKSGPPELSETDRANMQWLAWLADIETLDPELAAEGEPEEFAQEETDRSAKASKLIFRYQNRMKEKFNVAPKT